MQKFTVFALTTLLLASTAAQAEDVNSRYIVVLDKLQTPVTASTKHRVTAWVDPDHPKAVFKLGEPIHLFAQPNFDAYLTVMAIGPDGAPIQLYPNAYEPQQLVKAGRTLLVPGKSAPVEMVAGGTPGIEHLFVLASTQPTPVIPDEALSGDAAFRSIDGDPETLGRYIELAVKQPSEEPVFFDKKIRTTGDRNVVVTVVADDASSSQATDDTSSSAEDTEAPAREEPADEPTLSLAVDKADYVIGETVQMAVTTPRDCYVWVIDVSSDNSKHVLFPNKLMQDNFVRAGEQLTLSGGDSKVKIVAQAPAGIETVYTLCSEDPHAVGAISYDDMFPAADGTNPVVRALNWEPATTPPQIPEGIDWAQLSLTTK